jgi:tripartite ATP-independent transporter DctM subunit
MDHSVIALIGIGAVIVLMFMRVPIAVGLGLVAVVGFGYVVGPGPALGLLVDSPISTVTNFGFSVIPMFILMGSLVSASGMSRELFRAANAWFGHLPGGMAIATVMACGGFAAINGSAVATAATMTQVALPEMRRVGYDSGFSSGVIAAGGTLGIMIPPSVMFIIYAILTDNDIASLFIAGIVPGLLAILLYCITIEVMWFIKPSLMPRSPRADWHERLQSLRDVWATILLFVVVIGGIYGGLVTITEAAGLGVVGAMVIGVLRRRLDWHMIVESLVESLRTSAAIFFILIGAFLFQYFLAVTQAPQLLASFLTGLSLPPMGIMVLILAFYIVAGMFVDDLPVILLTVPIFYPVVQQLGFDPIWFGVIIVVTVEIALISPPVGMVCFIINHMAPDVGLGRIYRGVVPFVVADVVWLGLILFFPPISLWLVHTMG